MTSVSEATSIILDHLYQAGAEAISLGQSAGRILAETIAADRDLPPFDRVTMDGIALHGQEFENGRREFRVVATQAAGAPALRLEDPAGCIEIMTGALLPEGTDTIVRIEDVEVKNGVAVITVDTLSRGQFVHRRASDARADSTLLNPGLKISPAEIALLASVGKSTVWVCKFPRIAIVSTGDELVPVSAVPLPHQIRQSNASALEAALFEMQCPSDHFHVADIREVMQDKIRTIMATHDVIILSGGVSKGKFDFVPDVLETLGVRKLVHQVSQRPGKPFWFGVSDKHTVFALPGNPVSTFLCFLRYIRPWLLKSMKADWEFKKAALATAYTFEPPLTFFLQVKLRHENGQTLAWPETGGGSGDFANLKDVDGFLELPSERASFAAGEVFSFIPFR